MERKDARAYFQNVGLTYAVLTESDIHLLKDMVDEELAAYQVYGGNHARRMEMKVSNIRGKDIRILKRSGLVAARIQIDSSYFNRREGITFSQTGFIGFCGEFDDKNTAPILKAFVAWCGIISKQKNTA